MILFHNSKYCGEIPRYNRIISRRNTFYKNVPRKKNFEKRKKCSKIRKKRQIIFQKIILEKTFFKRDWNIFPMWPKHFSNVTKIFFQLDQNISKKICFNSTGQRVVIKCSWYSGGRVSVLVNMEYRWTQCCHVVWFKTGVTFVKLKYDPKWNCFINWSIQNWFYFNMS